MFRPFLEMAPAKINLALHVLGRRADGFHELDSIVGFADVADTLLFEPAAETRLEMRGEQGAGLTTGPDNLVLKALNELSRHVRLPGMSITLTKIIPVASGLGGGSADAAAALRGALRARGQSLSAELLGSIASRIGADVPACLFGKSCRMQGLGDAITEFKITAMPAVLVNPLVLCPTVQVFAAMGLRPGDSHLTGLDPLQPAVWRNDLTEAAASVQPVIRDVLAVLAETGAFRTVGMSGSGASCFGLADSIEQARLAAIDLQGAHPHWWVRATTLS